MESIILVTTILTIHVLAWFTPGPLFVLILRNSLIYSRKAGIWTALGIAVGNSIHIIYSVAGITIISQSDLAFNIIKFLGIGYLTYLGIRTLLIKSNSNNKKIEQQKDTKPWSAIKIGFLANILSPKASLFFASIFATVISSGASYFTIIFLMIAMPINSFVMATILSVFFTQQRVRLIYNKFSHIFNKVLGSALILLAIIIIFAK